MDIVQVISSSLTMSIKACITATLVILLGNKLIHLRWRWKWLVVLLAMLTVLWLLVVSKSDLLVLSRSGRLQTDRLQVDDLDRSVQDDLARVLEERRAHYQNVCQSGHIPGNVHPIFSYLPAHFSICLAPKAGCTFWKRLIYFLHGDTGRQRRRQQAASPFDLNRFYVHFSGRQQNKTLNFGNSHDHAMLFNTTRVMFSRDPWSRLWSGYVDKFVLPDSWLDHGKRILRHRLRAYAKAPENRSPLESMIYGSRQDDPPRDCADDVTFAEFLYYALKINHDKHWSPIHSLCNPCLLKPQVLGKVETFSQDASYALNISGLGYLLSNYSHASHVTDEMTLLIDYHFHLWSQRHELHSCLDVVGLARRLWRAFQYNGYIPMATRFPEDVLAKDLTADKINTARDHLSDHVVAAATKEKLSKSDWAALRHKIMTSAYRGVPRELLENVQMRFKWDFILFQYDPEPRDIFQPSDKPLTL